MLHIKNSPEVTHLFTWDILSPTILESSAKLKKTNQGPCLSLLGEIRNSAFHSVINLVLFETSVCWLKCLSLSVSLSTVATTEHFSLDNCKPILFPCVSFSLGGNLLLGFPLSTIVLMCVSITEPNRRGFTSFPRLAKLIKISSSSFFLVRY